MKRMVFLSALTLYVNTKNSQLYYEWQIKEIFDKTNMNLNPTWMVSVYKPRKINRLALTRTYSWHIHCDGIAQFYSVGLPLFVNLVFWFKLMSIGFAWYTVVLET